MSFNAEKEMNQLTEIHVLWHCYDFVALPFFYLIAQFMFTVFFYLIHFLTCYT